MYLEPSCASDCNRSQTIACRPTGFIFFEGDQFLGIWANERIIKASLVVDGKKIGGSGLVLQP